MVADPEQGRHIRFEFGFPEPAGEGIDDVIGAFDALTRASLRGVSNEIPGVGTLHRTEISEVLATLDREEAALLVGEGGGGKSAIAAAVATGLRDTGTAVLLLRATSFHANDTIGSVQERLGLTTPPVSAVGMVSAAVPCCIIVDQLDCALGHPLYTSLLGLLSTARELANVRVLAVSRTWQAEADPELARVQFPRVESKPLPSSQVARLLRDPLGIDPPSEVLVELGMNLLNLSLIADLAVNGDDVTKVSGRLDLWHRYRDSINSREGPGAVDKAVQLATASLGRTERELAMAAAPDASTSRLISRGVLVPSRGARFRFRHDQLQDYFYAWNAALRQRVMPDAVLGAIGERFGRGVIRWMHLMLNADMPEDEPNFVRAVLEGDWQFYTKAVVLDVLKAQREPQADVVDILARSLSDTSLTDYFFRDLDVVEWFRPLDERRLFASPPGLRLVEGGYQLVPWPQGAYLARIAPKLPKEVARTAESLESDNPAVYRDLIQAALAMRDAQAAKLVPAIIKWLDLEVEWLLPHDALELGKRLAAGRSWRAALRLAEALMQPKLRPRPPDSLLSPEAEPRRERYAFEETIKQLVPLLAERRPLETLRALEGLLVAALRIELPDRADEGSWWRAAVEDHEQNHEFGDYKELVFVGLRDALARLFEKDPEAATRITRRYLRSRWSILRRLALHQIRLELDQFLDLATGVLSAPQHWFDVSEHHEFYWLLTEAFPRLDEAGRQRIQRCAWREHPKRKGLSREKRDELTRRHQWRMLWGVQHLIHGDLRERYEELLQVYGESERPDFLVWSSGGTWVGPTSPIGSEEIVGMGPRSFASYVEGWSPSGEFMGPSPDGLARALQAAVAQDPTSFAVEAAVFGECHLRGLYACHVLMGLEEALKAGKRFAWEPVIALCEATIDLDDEDVPHEQGDSGFKVSWLRREMADLLGEAVRRDEFAPAEALAHRILSLLLRLTDEPEPDEEYERQYGGDNMDPVTLRINTARGKAVDALMLYALWKARAVGRRESEEERANAKLEPLVRAAFEAKMDPARERSPAIHSAFGQYLLHFHFLDSEWLLASLPQIFPEAEGREQFWTAAWLGHVVYGHYSDEFFRALRHHYERSLRCGLAWGKHSEQILEHVGQHLAIAYWRGLEQLEGEDSLVSLLFTEAPRSARLYFLWALGRGLHDVKLARDDPAWLRLRALWEARVLGTDPDDESVQEEASRLAWWLEVLPESLAESFPLVRATAERMRSEMHVSDVVDYLASQSAQWPAEATQVLDVLTARPVPSQFLGLRPEKIRMILQSALRADAASQALAIEIVNRFGQRGDHRFRDLLE